VRDLEALTRQHEPREQGRASSASWRWRVINAAKYRAFRTERQELEAEKKRRQRESARGHVPGRPGDGDPDVRRETGDVRRETGEKRTNVRPSRSAAQADDANRLADVCSELAAKLQLTPEEICARVSRIEASDGAERVFTDPLAKGLSEAWISAALVRALALKEQASRPVPL
jgi:hypothetical protein